MFIDTHCHLAYMIGKSEAEFLIEDDLLKIDAIIATSAQAGVDCCVDIGTNPVSSIVSLQIAQRYPLVYCTATIHPLDVTPAWQDQVYTLDEFIAGAIKTKKFVGIGECGLDYHYSGYDRQTQHDVFVCMIELAYKYDLPLVIHTRDAFDDTIVLLQKNKFEGMRGVFHCYSETVAGLDAVFDLGFIIGITGAVSYPKNQYLRDVVSYAGLDRIVLETDAPFLSPQGKRGKPNTPEYIPLIAASVAQVLGCSVEEVARRTTANAKKLYGI